MKRTYRCVGNYYLPDIAIPNPRPTSIGHYGRMRKRHLEQTHTGNCNIPYTILAKGEETTVAIYRMGAEFLVHSPKFREFRLRSGVD